MNTQRVEGHTPKGCPFCGDDAVSFQTKDGSWHVSCEAQKDEECRGVDGGELDGYINEQFAVEAWNRRASIERLEKVNEALVEALGAAHTAMRIQQQIERNRNIPGSEGWDALIEGSAAALSLAKEPA